MSGHNSGRSGHLQPPQTLSHVTKKTHHKELSVVEESLIPENNYNAGYS